MLLLPACSKRDAGLALFLVREIPQTNENNNYDSKAIQTGNVTLEKFLIIHSGNIQTIAIYIHN